MNKKYEILNGNDAECIKCYDKTLYRIRALKDFANVKTGDIGGFIESESNLSQEGNAWIYDNAMIYDDARIYDNAKICGNARIHGNTMILDNARIYDNAVIYGDAMIWDNARIYGDAMIGGDAEIYGGAKIESDDCFFMATSIGSRNGTTTFFTGADGKIYVACDCFKGDIDEFTKAVQKTHGDNIHGEMYRMAIEMAKKKLGVKL